MPCHHRPPPPKTAPSNKQNDNVAILARVPAISSVFFLFFVCLCQNTCPPPHLASIDNKKKTRATWARHLCFLPVDYQTTKSSRGFFISERCWIAIHLLSNTILPALFFCSLSITYTTFHFKTLCHPSEIPSKSFVLCSTRNYLLPLSWWMHTFTFPTIFFPFYSSFRRKNLFSNSN